MENEIFTRLNISAIAVLFEYLFSEVGLFFATHRWENMNKDEVEIVAFTEPETKVSKHLRFSIWLFCCVRLTTSTHDIDFIFSGVKECNETRLKM